MDAALRDLTVGGNVVWQSSTYSAITYPMDARADEGSFALVGLMARYELSKHLSASLNLNNVLGYGPDDGRQAQPWRLKPDRG